MTPTAASYRSALLDDCVPFWFPRAVDTEHGGFLHTFDRDGALVDDDKSVWAQGRTAWMLLALYLDVERRPEWLTYAESGLAFLERAAYDAATGRYAFQVTRAGLPLRTRRYGYGHAFAAIAYAAHAAATGSERSRGLALRDFDFFVDWHFTPGRIPPKETDVRPAIALTPRMITLVTAQELELRLGPSPHTRRWIDRACEELERLFVRRGERALLELVAPDGSIIEHSAGRQLNPGHAIECAWFLMEQGRRDGDTRLLRLGLDVLEWSLERGWDPRHGGLLYFCDLRGRPVTEYWANMKFWWPHDEALIATALAWRLTGAETWRAWHDRVHAWSFGHFADPEFGEWYGYLERDGQPANTLKGSLWKSFFHHPRAMLLCMQHLAALEAPAPRA